MKEEVIDWAKTIGMVVALFLGIQTVAFASFHIPSESMSPTLAVGDRVLVTKFPYGYSKNSVAFGLGGFLPDSKGRLFGSLPKRGDIVVFKHTKDSKTMIKRVIGLPGDRIAMKNGQLFLNREAVPAVPLETYTFTDRSGDKHPVIELKETLPGGIVHSIFDITNRTTLDNMAEIVVPEGHVFMMGDNRNMSADSRDSSGPFSLGLVPVSNLMGKAVIITYSLGSCRKSNPEMCPSGRLLHKLYFKAPKDKAPNSEAAAASGSTHG